MSPLWVPVVALGALRVASDGPCAQGAPPDAKHPPGLKKLHPATAAPTPARQRRGPQHPQPSPAPRPLPPNVPEGQENGWKTERKATTIKLWHNRQVKIILLFLSKPGRRINWSVPFDSSLKKAKSCFIHGCSTRGEGVHKDKPQSSNGSGRKHVLSSAPRCNRGSKDG